LSLRWDTDEITPRTRALPEKVNAGLFALTEFWAPKVQSHARVNASWVDQTGNARQGLSARAQHAPTSHAIVLFHSVPYGIWLEVRWSGRYAVILPTIESLGRQVMGDVRGLMGRLS